MKLIWSQIDQGQDDPCADSMLLYEVALLRSETSEETLEQEVAGTMSRASCGNKEMKKDEHRSQQLFTETTAMHGLC